jgi:hypothetical protein
MCDYCDRSATKMTYSDYGKRFLCNSCFIGSKHQSKTLSIDKTIVCRSCIQNHENESSTNNNDTEPSIYASRTNLNETHNDNFNSQCSALFKSELYSDYTWMHNGKEYKVHKFVLICNSGFFATRFNGNWDESKEGQILDESIDNELLECVLEIMYTGNSQLLSVLTIYKLIKLMEIADYLEILYLQEHLIKIKNNIKITKNNVYKLLESDLLEGRQTCLNEYIENHGTKELVVKILSEYPNLIIDLMIHIYGLCDDENKDGILDKIVEDEDKMIDNEGSFSKKSVVKRKMPKKK